MPRDDRLRLHQVHRREPAGPQASQDHPIDAIGWAQLDAAPPMLSLKNQDLVAEGEELGFQVGPTAVVYLRFGLGHYRTRRRYGSSR